MPSPRSTPDGARSGVDLDETQEDPEWVAPVAQEIPKAATPSSIGTFEDASGSIASRSPSYKVDHIGRTVKSTKLRHAWTLFLGGVETKVELEHSRLTGKKKVLVDGKLLFSTTDKHLNWCWEHPESKARIGLNSENGKHVLRCEEPEVKTLSKDAEGNSAQLDELSSAASFEAGTCNSETLPEEGCTDGAVHEDAEYEVFSSGFSDSPIRQDLARKYATCENDLQDYDAEIAEEAKPSIPSYLVTRPQRKVALQEISAETARLNALLGVKDAQIAALQDELRRCALGREEASGPMVEAVPTEAVETEPISPIQQLEGPSPQLPPPQLVASVPSEHFLVAELPTTPVPYPKVTSGDSPGGRKLLSPPALSAVSPLDEEELDVTRRRGPAHFTPPVPGPQVARPSPCMTPPPQPSPFVVQRYVSTPRRCAGAAQAEAMDPNGAEHARGRAGSMPPCVHWASPGPPWCVEPNPRSSGRHERSSVPPPNARSLSVQPRPCWSRTPGPASRSITPRRDARQVQAPVFHMPQAGMAPGLRGCPPPWQLLPQWPQGPKASGLHPGSMLPPVFFPSHVPGPLAGPVPMLAHPPVVQPCRLNQPASVAAGMAPDLRLMAQPRPVHL